MRVRNLFLVIAIGTSTIGAPTAGAPSPAIDPFDVVVAHDLAFAASQLEAAARVVPLTRYPSATKGDGTWATTDATAWTSGFFPASLWRIHEATGCAAWSSLARTRQRGLESQRHDTSSHDVGFKILVPFGTAYRLAHDDADRLVVLDAAAALASRYDPTVGAIRSWNGPTPAHFRVIVDNLMNLELLFWASNHGGRRTWSRLAVRHALTTLANHVRTDGSTYQGIDFDPATGTVQGRFTHQGADVESTWSRGQAWAIHGFTMVYRETLDSRFRDAARRVADYYVDHLPADHVPTWDLDLSASPDAPRDSAAAAIAASGLLELAALESDAGRADRYRQVAKETLTSLSTPAYLAEGSGSSSILLHGTQNAPKQETDSGLIYGDYYFIEALLRYRSWAGGDIAHCEPMV